MMKLGVRLVLVVGLLPPSANALINQLANVFRGTLSPTANTRTMDRIIDHPLGLSTLTRDDVQITPFQRSYDMDEEDEEMPIRKNSFFSRRGNPSRASSLEKRLEALEQENMELSRKVNAPFDYIDASIETPHEQRNRRMDTPFTGAGPAEYIIQKTPKVPVHGGSLMTWTFPHPSVERIHVALKTEGRPLEAEVGLWSGPDNTPHKMRVYIEDGAFRPFSAVIETPMNPSTVSVRNTAQMEFPLEAHVLAEAEGDRQTRNALPGARSNHLKGHPTPIQGGALRTFAFDTFVESVQVLLKTDGRPLRARVELLQGPTNNKQVVEVYTEDGLERPFFMVMETPGNGNVVRVVNAATIEFPLTAWVEPYAIGKQKQYSPTEPIMSGDRGQSHLREFVRPY